MDHYFASKIPAHFAKLLHNSGVQSKNKSSCTNTLLSYEPFSVLQDIEGENQFFSLIANGLYLNIKISVKLVFE